MNVREKRDMTGTKRECTRCPIFLLQIAQVGLTADYCDADWEYGEEGEMRYLPDDILLSGSALDDFLVNHGFGRRYWTTFDGGVWFTREEAENAAERRIYHYGVKGKDWRVFCVCAQGTLEEILNEHSNYD